MIIAGNHDSAARLEAPIPLLEELNTSIVGVVPRTDLCKIDFDSLLIPLYNKEGKREAICLAVPYLRQGDYPASKEGKDTYVEGVTRMYRQLYDYADSQRQPARPCLRWDTCMRLVLNCRKMTGANGPSWEDLNLYR